MPGLPRVDVFGLKIVCSLALCITSIDFFPEFISPPFHCAGAQDVDRFAYLRLNTVGLLFSLWRAVIFKIGILVTVSADARVPFKRIEVFLGRVYWGILVPCERRVAHELRQLLGCVTPSMIRERNR